MFCQQCGKDVPAEADACPSCGAKVQHDSGKADEIMRQSKEATRDAVSAVSRFAINPVGGLRAAFESLGEARAVAAGGAMGVVAVITMGIGLYLFQRRAFGGWMAYGQSAPGFGALIKSIIVALVGVAALFAVVTVIRMLSKSREGFGAGAFIAGAASLYPGILFFLLGILGMGNFEVLGILMIFANAYVVLTLYAGYSRLCGMGEGQAALFVPITLLVSAWIAKIAYAAMY